MILIQQVKLPKEIEEVKELIREFTAWALPLTEHIEDVPTFNNLEDELAGLPGEFAPPYGRLLLATSNGKAAGCIALKQHSATAGELKRFYVRPEFRGQGVGWRLVDALINEARMGRYKKIVLDSHQTMTKAHEIYGVFGFQKVSAPEGFPPKLAEEVVFMELDL